MKKTSASQPTPAIDLRQQPGHSIRRLQQIAFAVFMQEAASAGTTPVQYAVLQTLSDQPGIDQRTLARAVSLDTSTIGGVVDRLEARALLARSLSPQDRRVRLLHLTEAGEALRRELLPTMLQAQQRMLDPLTEAERQQFMDMVQRVIAHHASVDDSTPPEG